MEVSVVEGALRGKVGYISGDRRDVYLAGWGLLGVSSSYIPKLELHIVVVFFSNIHHVS